MYIYIYIGLIFQKRYIYIYIYTYICLIIISVNLLELRFFCDFGGFCRSNCASAVPVDRIVSYICTFTYIFFKGEHVYIYIYIYIFQIYTIVLVCLCEITPKNGLSPSNLHVSSTRSAFYNVVQIA